VIRLVLFDIDGTLIRTGGAGVRAFDRTGELEFGIRNGASHMRFAGRTDTSLVREFFASHGLDPSPVNFERFFSRYLFLLDHLQTQVTGKVCDGVWDFIRSLQTLSPPPMLGLLTGNVRLGAEIKLRHFGLWDLFDVGAFGDDHECRNELATIAQRRGGKTLGRPLCEGETLVVGDTPFDIECGRAIGARVLAVATGGATLDALRRHRPDWAVADLTRTTAGEINAPKPTSAGPGRPRVTSSQTPAC
jgi:phosphoglycolate phosphatase-like HAD superfamily hydrolase